MWYYFRNLTDIFYNEDKSMKKAGKIIGIVLACMIGFITIHGNHELKNKAEYKDLFVSTFGYNSDTVTEINGFSCIAFSGERT